MLYSLKDKFLLDDILVEVRWINQGNAFVAAVEDQEVEGVRYYSSCTYEMLDEYGIDRRGNKAITVNNGPSEAV